MVSFDIKTNAFHLETRLFIFEKGKRFLREVLFSTHR